MPEDDKQPQTPEEQPTGPDAGAPSGSKPDAASAEPKSKVLKNDKPDKKEKKGKKTKKIRKKRKRKKTRKKTKKRRRKRRIRKNPRSSLRYA